MTAATRDKPDSLGRKPFTDAEKAKIQLLHSEGWSARAIGKELGRSGMGVSRVAKTMGLSWDRAQTAAATEARATDMRARRAQLAERLLNEAEGLLDAMRRPYMDHTFTMKDGTFVQHAALPTPQDKHQLARAAATLIGQHLRMAEFDMPKDVQGASDVDAWLDALTTGAGH